MSLSCDIFLALRYLRGKRKNRLLSAISFISVAGITVGVMALIIIISVMNGFQRDLREKILSAQPHIIIKNRDGIPISGYREIMENAGKLRDVESVYPIVRTQAMAMSLSGSTGTELIGMDFSDTKSRKRVERLMGKISGFDFNAGGALKGIILGKELSRNLGVGTGDMVRIMLPDGRVTPFGVMPTVRRFKVSGIFQSGIYQYDMATAYIDIGDARGLLGIGDSVTSLDMEVSDIFDAERTASELTPLLGGDIKVRTWKEMNKHLFAALKLEKVAMFSILLLIVIVAVFNIANTLIMTVIEKRGEIAVLKSLGASQIQIMRIFMLEGLFTGFIGTFAGSGLGLILSFLLQKYEFLKLDETVFYTSKIPVDMDPVTISVIVFSSLLLSFLSAIYPSIYASRLNPAEVLRFE